MKFIVFIFNDEGKRSPSFLLLILLCRLWRNLGFSDLFTSVVKGLVGARHLLREPGTRGRWRHALLLLCLNNYFRKIRGIRHKLASSWKKGVLRLYHSHFLLLSYVLLNWGPLTPMVVFYISPSLYYHLLPFRIDTLPFFMGSETCLQLQTKYVLLSSCLPLYHIFASASGLSLVLFIFQPSFCPFGPFLRESFPSHILSVAYTQKSQSCGDRKMRGKKMFHHLC